MNKKVKKLSPFKKLFYRIFQGALNLALPFLPDREPKIIEKTELIPAVLKENGKTNPLIVTGKNVRGLGLTLPLEEKLIGEGMSYAVFDGVVANPTTDNVLSALSLYKESACDCLIAFGGGSPMDCAKGVGALVARPEKTLSKLKGVLKVGKKIPLLVAVPTTAGTGSETTLAAVIVDSQTRHKYAISDFSLIPSYAVLDEEVTMTLPKSVVAATGMDALTHAVEAFINKSGNKGTRKNALEAIKLIFENLEISFFEGTREARKNMLVASFKAGKAFTRAYVGYVHALAHPLGGKYDIPHGLANAVILPVVLEAYGKAAHKKLWKIAVFCGLADKDTPYSEGAKVIIDKIKDMNEKFGIPKTLTIKEEDLDELSYYAAKEANPLYPVPALFSREQLKELYKKIGNPNDAD